MNTQQFFSDVTTGKIQKPLRPWKPFFRYVPEDFNNAFNKHEGDFDRHIATSIPMYREMQLIVGDAIVKAYKDKDHPVLCDIAGSEGTWAKAITACSDGRIASYVIDCNNDMQESFHELCVPQRCEFKLRSFLEDSETIRKYDPMCTAAIVHAGMAFQFMPFSRDACITEVKEKYLDKNGLLLIEEKVIPDRPSEWFQNETLKNKFKRMYYSDEAIQQKKRDVVNAMDANLVEVSELLAILRLHFAFVFKYYQAGNFVGLACSDSRKAVEPFKHLPKIIF